MTVVRVDLDPDALTLTIVAEFDEPAAQVWQVWADPRVLELCQQCSRLGDRLDVGLYELLTASPGPVHEPGRLEDGHVLLHRGRAHRIPPRQARHGQRPAHRSADDVPPRAIGQRPEDAVHPLLVGCCISNHTVVGYRPVDETETTTRRER